MKQRDEASGQRNLTILSMYDEFDKFIKKTITVKLKSYS
jgi:hypothetical protein